MNRLQAPFVELNFYFGDRPSADAMRDVAIHCLDREGRFAGEAYVALRPGARSFRFAAASVDAPDGQVLQIEENELRDLLNDEDALVQFVRIWSAIGVTKKAPEEIDFASISPEGAALDEHPVVVTGDGWLFGPKDFSGRRAKKAGAICYRKFTEICRELDPDYAAILVEDWIPCRYDLKRGKGHSCFFDFYVSSRAYGQPFLREMKRVYRDAYLERLPTGVYFSTYEFFNPEGIDVPEKIASERSRKVAKMLASP